MGVLAEREEGEQAIKEEAGDPASFLEKKRNYL